MSTNRFKFYHDPGHGWLAVPRRLLSDLGIAAEISSYSYQKGGTVYLEEDCDASLFHNAMEARGRKYETESVYQERTPIRRYDCYQPDAIVSVDAFADLFSKGSGNG